LSKIKTILASRRQPSVKVLEERLNQTRIQIRDLHHQQRLLSGMVKQIAAGGCPTTVDKAMWVEMLQAAGMNDEAMSRWHTEFEKRNPQAHHEFLLSLGISETEAQQIRHWSAIGLRETVSV
jgi:MerR family transcriptional regulator, thiopeptide resistance regulator